MANRGTWQAGSVFDPGDTVTNGGLSYTCLLGHRSDNGNRPGNGTFWLASAIGAAQLANLTPGDLTPGPAVRLVYDVADHATQNIDKVITLAMVAANVKVEVAGTNGANANSVQVDNGITGNHITDAMSTNGKVAGDMVSALSIFPANWAIPAGGTLRIIQTKAGGVHAFRVVIDGYLGTS